MFKIDKYSRQVFFKDKKLELTRAEYEILTLLISKKSIDVIIGRLRSKIEENPKQPQYIISVRGVGYKLEA